MPIINGMPRCIGGAESSLEITIVCEAPEMSSEKRRADAVSGSGAAPLLTVDQLAERWHTTRGAIYMLRYRGELPRAVRVGRRLLFPLDEVLAWEQRCTA